MDEVKAKQNTWAAKNKLEKVKAKLKEKAVPTGSNMKTVEEELYENEETGTVVYKVTTSNFTLPYPVTEYVRWGYFLVGNEDGFMHSYNYVDSEACFKLGEISEDEKFVRIQRSGYETTYFGIKAPVKDLEFEKSRFQSYTTSLN